MNPPTLQDDVFGTLRWDDRVSWYEAKMPFPGAAQVSVSIPVEGEPAATAIRRARPIFQTIQNREPEYRVAATRHLLDLHNDSWNEGEEIDADTFRSKMTLESIVIYSSGGAEIYYGDGDLFWGHTILIGLTEDLNFRDATIAG